jgi:hypothetical protein
MSPFTMQSKAEIFEGYARECQRRAQAVSDRRLKGLFSDLAQQWRELANTARNLSEHAVFRKEFYRRGFTGGAASRNSP